MKILKFVLPVLFIVLYSSCIDQGKKIKIGLLFDNYKAPRWKKEQVYFIEKAEELGAEVIVRSAEGNPDDQLIIAEEMISQGIDILVVIASNVNSAAGIVRRAHEKKIKVIAYDRLIRNCPLDLYISFDNKKVGLLMAKYMVDKVPKGNFVLMNGDKSDDNAIAVYNGVMDILKPHTEKGDIKIIYSGFMEEWSGKEAAYYTEKVLQFSGDQINAIISSYDGLTDGIVNTLEKYGLEKKIPVTGQDAEIAACARILNGKQIMTIYKPGKELAHRSAEIAFQIAKNEKIQIVDSVFNGRQKVPTLLLDPIAVDKKNIESTIIKDGFFTREEIENANKASKPHS